MLKPIFTLCLISSTSALAAGPCSAQREAKSDANKSFTQCLKQWHKSMKPGEPDPSDDCLSKFQAIQSASKALKACRTDALKNKETKENQKAE